MVALKLIHGTNFSGRTDVLRASVNRECNEFGRSVVHIGPEPFASFSGLAETVEDEFDLTSNSVWRVIAEELGIQALIRRELSTLSGGEEAACAIGVGLALNTRLIALDCAMEQLDRERREKILASLARSKVDQIMIVDNRFAEWSFPDYVQHERCEGTPNQNGTRQLRGSVELPQLSSIPKKISISELRHRYGVGSWILNGIDLTLTPGNIFHLAGTNGAGKSTLAKVLVGALQPQSGHLSVDGNAGEIQNEPLWASSFWDRLVGNARRSLWDHPGRLFAYHFQNPDSQLFQPTVLRELTSSADQQDRAATDVHSLVDAVAEAFGLTDILDTHPQDLPFVLRKRVALAATFACGSPWIILDEPTLGQDDVTVAQLTTLIRSMASRGTGFIIISHAEHFLNQIGAKRLTLFNGTMQL